MVRQMENSTAGSITGLNSGGVWLVGFGLFFFFFVACLHWKSWGDRSVKASRVGGKKGLQGEAQKGKVEEGARTLLQRAGWQGQGGDNRAEAWCLGSSCVSLVTVIIRSQDFMMVTKLPGKADGVVGYFQTTTGKLVWGRALGVEMLPIMLNSRQSL